MPILRIRVETWSRPTTWPRSSSSSCILLLRNKEIVRANHVWAADITYLPMARGFCYLMAIMDWASRRVLAWRLSNTLDVSFCVEALEEALKRYGAPEIFSILVARTAT